MLSSVIYKKLSTIKSQTIQDTIPFGTARQGRENGKTMDSKVYITSIRHKQGTTSDQAAHTTIYTTEQQKCSTAPQIQSKKTTVDTIKHFRQASVHRHWPSDHRAAATDGKS
jgi:hypothetical protein